jgi:hypothetical protein
MHHSLVYVIFVFKKANVVLALVCIYTLYIKVRPICARIRYPRPSDYLDRPIDATDGPDARHPQFAHYCSSGLLANRSPTRRPVIGR